jgi:hypothetical protein
VTPEGPLTRNAFGKVVARAGKEAAEAGPEVDGRAHGGGVPSGEAVGAGDCEVGRLDGGEGGVGRMLRPPPGIKA